MTIKFACINPENGETLFLTTREELIAHVANRAVNMYIYHLTGGSPFTFVETLSDGSEKWYAPTGEEVLSHAQVKAEAQRILQRDQSFADASVLPTTILGSQ